MNGFEPKIVGFLCNWCSYAGADLAGVSRIQYPPNLRVIRVMCSGRIDPTVVLEILANGADGVMIAGCHIGDCHYVDGNMQAERKFVLTKRLVEKSGLESNRLRLEWISASEGQRFADVVREFTDQLRALGPTPVLKDKEIKLNLMAAKKASEEYRLRSLVSKEMKLVEQGNVYGDLITQDEFDEVMTEAVGTEFMRNKIKLILSKEQLSAKALSKKLNLEPEKVLRHIVSLRQRGWIDLTEIQGNTPVYKAIGVD